MRTEDKYVGTHEFTNKTQRMIRFAERDVQRSKADFPYPYISKGLWEHLGEPYVIQITIEAVLPPVKDDDHGVLQVFVEAERPLEDEGD